MAVVSHCVYLLLLTQYQKLPFFLCISSKRRQYSIFNLELKIFKGLFTCSNIFDSQNSSVESGINGIIYTLSPYLRWGKWDSWDIQSPWLWLHTHNFVFQVLFFQHTFIIFYQFSYRFCSYILYIYLSFLWNLTCFEIYITESKIMLIQYNTMSFKEETIWKSK